MARHNYPGAKTEPGIVICYDCRAPCGGWVVLYDRQKGARLKIPEPVEETGRYILVHRPSNNCLWPFETLDQAKEFTRAASKGEDPTNGLLPRTTKPTKTERAAAALVDEIKTSAGDETDDEPENETAAAPKDPVENPFEFHLEFKRTMLERFPPSRIADKLDYLLNIKKPVALRNLDSGERETIDVDDGMTQLATVKAIMEMNEGKAKERPDVKAPVKRSWADLNKQLENSPKALDFMLQHCLSIKAKKAKAKPHAGSNARTEA